MSSFEYSWGWLGGANVLGKLPVPGRPTNLDYSRAKGLLRLQWVAVICTFFSLFSFSLSLEDGPI